LCIPSAAPAMRRHQNHVGRRARTRLEPHRSPHLHFHRGALVICDTKIGAYHRPARAGRKKKRPNAAPTAIYLHLRKYLRSAPAKGVPSRRR
jgi:hypothetical protein